MTLSAFADPDPPLTDAQLDEFEMELGLAAFAKLVRDDGVELRESHCIAYRAGWQAAHALTREDHPR